MHEEILVRASEIINSKADYVGDGMEGYVVLSLIDNDGYPVSSTLSISKADGVNWMTFISDTNGNKAKRIEKCNKASVCLASSSYNITLTGIMEIITDPDVKKEHWQKIFQEAFNSTPDDPGSCVLRFKTERYNLFFASDDTEGRGVL
jgi:general stress protein 26